ncbi:hypothetical protein TrRE_jg11496, partial [Triparma retinervis]
MDPVLSPAATSLHAVSGSPTSPSPWSDVIPSNYRTKLVAEIARGREEDREAAKASRSTLRSSGGFGSRPRTAGA